MAKTVSIRLSDEQYEELVARADHERRKVSDYVRMCIFTRPTDLGVLLDEPYLPKVEPHSGFDPQSDDPRKSVAVALASKPNVIKAKKQAEAAVAGWNPDPRLSKEFATRGKGKKKGGKK